MMADDNWIKVSERRPPYGKLVYTRDDQDGIGVYTRYQYPGIGDGWSSRISTDNNEIIEWLEQHYADELQGICVYCGEIQQYESLEQKSSEEGNRLRVEHIKQCPKRPELKLIAYCEELQDAVIEALRCLQGTGEKTIEQVKDQLRAALNQSQQQTKD